MSRILIIQEEPAWQSALRRSLKEYHDLVIASNRKEIAEALDKELVELVIMQVHFKSDNFVDVLKRVRNHPRHMDVPVVCFCGLRTQLALTVNDAIAKASCALGATRYISIEQFCQDQNCDLEGIRHAIEEVLEQRYRQGKRL